VPLGARTHTARRRLGTGIARIMRGDSFVPRAALNCAALLKLIR
jgi:hypothetical protein